MTESAYHGDLGGLAGADATCQTEAEAAGLSGTYRAWLSGSISDDPASTFPGAKQYVRRDGAPIAANFADLTDGTIENPINLTADGQTPDTDAVGLGVWTGTSATGVHSGAGCNSFNGTTGVGQVGLMSATDSTWSGEGQADCTTPKFVYCFEQ